MMAVTTNLTLAGVGGRQSPSKWDSESTYQFNAIIFDRGGIWQATAENTNSQPISGNADWELVGGTPYVDITIEPQDWVPPLYDVDLNGPGLVILPFVEGSFLVIEDILALTSEGDAWGGDPACSFKYKDASGPDVTSFGLNNPVTSAMSDSSPLPFFSMILPAGPSGVGYEAGNYITANLPNTIGQSIVIVTNNDPSDNGGGHGSQFGTRTLRYVLHYSIRPAVATKATFFLITAVDQGSKTFTVNGNASAFAGSMSIVGSTGNNATYTIVSATDVPVQSDAITGVNQGTKTITVAGDQSAAYTAGSPAIISGSTGNDGTYTVVSAVFTTITAIIVAEAIPDATVDGNIGHPDETEIVVSEAIPSATGDGWVKQ